MPKKVKGSGKKEKKEEKGSGSGSKSLKSSLLSTPASTSLAMRRTLSNSITIPPTPRSAVSSMSAKAESSSTTRPKSAKKKPNLNVDTSANFESSSRKDTPGGRSSSSSSIMGSASKKYSLSNTLGTYDSDSIISSAARAKMTSLVGEVTLRNAHGGHVLHLTTEKVLHDHLVSIKTLLLRYHANKMSHDPMVIRSHLSKRAQEAVDEDLHRLVTKLQHFQGPNPNHRNTSYSQLATSLSNELESILFSQEFESLASLQGEHNQHREETARLHSKLAQENAVKDQTIASLAADKAELENMVRELQRSTEATQRELERALHNQSTTHQHAVEVRMQGLDYKAEVDRRCAKVMKSVQSRMGFVPAGVQKQIMYLKVLKAPGDPNYDDVRLHTYTRSHVDTTTKVKVPVDDNDSNNTEAIDGPLQWVRRVIQHADAKHGRRRRQIDKSELVSMANALDDLVDNEIDGKKGKKEHHDWIRWATNKGLRNSSASSSNASGLVTESLGSYDEEVDTDSINEGQGYKGGYRQQQVSRSARQNVGQNQQQQQQRSSYEDSKNNNGDDDDDDDESEEDHQDHHLEYYHNFDEKEDDNDDDDDDDDEDDDDDDNDYDDDEEGKARSSYDTEDMEFLIREQQLAHQYGIR